MQTAGYSGTTLVKKLGIKTGFAVKIVNPPDHYFDLLHDMPKDVNINAEETTPKNFIHYFTTHLQELQRDLPVLKKEIRQDGMIWISWPKKAAKVPTDVSEDQVRKFALANGLVDIKVCAIDARWSGLKLVIPVRERTA